ncbi:SDR family NAD(P)-dependent oxidoreductase [Brevibacterium casei]|uniref:3-oxoacyl-[acyl-carrier-protein] reductase FabG n=1 Tax=Brevibacterium casei TaxID=33889 RepID=A0A449DB60_9MICO|nr:SDR family NAD(P)-dependent oxidoreductase [Brevibacterium casei]VEW14793.1 3-oxoacyl-[acyl-carrier-protein] reductase FabG [Brevibacterium casei]
MTSIVRTGPVVLITGATGGLGAAFADYFARRGWTAVLSARDPATLERLARRIEARHGARVETIPADLTTAAGIATITNYCTTRRIDAVINNAGAAHTRPFAVVAREAIEDEIVLDFHAHVMITHAALGQMVRRGTGTIVLVASLAGLIPADDDSGYVAAKAGLIGLAESLHYQLSTTGVRISALCPGFVRTNIYRAAGDTDPDLPSWMWSTPERTIARGMRTLARKNTPIIVPEHHDRLLLTAWRLLPTFLRARIARTMYDHPPTVDDAHSRGRVKDTIGFDEP